MATFEKRVLKNGGIRWRAKVRIKGHRPLLKVFQRKTDAKRWAAKVEAEIQDGLRVQTTRDQRRTLAQLFEVYRQEVLPTVSAKSQSDRIRHLDWWQDQLGGDVLLSQLSRPMLADGLRALARGKSASGRPASAASRNRYLATLRHALSWAVREEWIQQNPATLLRAREPRGIVRFLSEDERARLLDAVRGTGRLELLVHMALTTGARQGELLSLRWPDIDLDRRVARLEETKNGDRRALPLHDTVVQLLIERGRVRRIDNDLVFLSDDHRSRGTASFPRTAWFQALEDAGIENFRFHDLRHTFASYLAMHGASLAEIAEAMGHKTLAMVSRYAHLSESHTHSVVRNMVDSILT
ncbi:MAG: site-specific integrase [Acidobacteriota bacterium]